MAKEDFNLDNFKETWQKQEVEQKYDKEDIEQMLNKKSRNYVKQILWISIIEFIVFSLLSMGYFLMDETGGSLALSLEKSLKIKFTEDDKFILNIFDSFKDFIGIMIPIIFIYLFYKSYQKIKVEEDLKNFITHIMKFRKTVNYYLFTNVFLFFISFILIMIYISQILGNYNIILNDTMLMGFFAAIVFTVVVLGFVIGIYYLIVYGVILGRLGRNLKKLKEIEKEKL